MAEDIDPEDTGTDEAELAAADAPTLELIDDLSLDAAMGLGLARSRFIDQGFGPDVADSMAATLYGPAYVRSFEITPGGEPENPVADFGVESEVLMRLGERTAAFTAVVIHSYTELLGAGIDAEYARQAAFALFNYGLQSVSQTQAGG